MENTVKGQLDEKRETGNRWTRLIAQPSKASMLMQLVDIHNILLGVFSGRSKLWQTDARLLMQVLCGS